MADLVVQGLLVRHGRTIALHNIDLAAVSGRITCLIGSNGAGKTSLLRALSGLQRPAAGSIKLDGAEMSGQPPHRVAGYGVAHVPEGRQVFAALTVAQNLELGAWRISDTAEIARRRAGVFARFPRLAERQRQLAGSLSGGEQQMLAIGRALMSSPRLLLLDEPSMGLAPLIEDEIFAIIASLRDEGATVLLVEQNASAALDIADDAYVLESGRIALHGPAQEVAHDPKIVAAYLGG